MTKKKVSIPILISGIILVFLLQILGVFFPSFIFSILVLFPAYSIIVLGAFIMLFLTIRSSIKKGKEEKAKAFLPLILNILLLALVFFNPFNRVIQYAEFAVKYNARMEAISLYYDGELTKSKVGTNTYMLQKNNYLSDGGEVVKAGDKVLFFTVRGIIDNFSGYVYSPDGTPPTEKDIQANFLERRKVQEHWYYIVCT